MRLTRYSCVLLAAALGLGGVGAGSGQAARDSAAPSGERRIEILVLEVSGCNVCGLIKQNVLPLYAQTPRAQKVPMRFVDVTRLDELKIGLGARVDTVPTTVVMVDGREADRITGYWAPETFLRLIARILDSAE